MFFTKAKRFLLGEPLLTHHDSHERIPKWKALSTLSSDALSSVAYATDSILFTLTAFATYAVGWSIPIALAIAALLAIVTASYHQTIEAYPSGGGAYTVAKENLGTYAGLVAGAALLIDYVLTVSVSVASGVENIASAFPLFAEHKAIICVLVILVITFLNLRGIRESATIFALPTYFFIISVFVLIGTGLFKLATGQIIQQEPILQGQYPAVPVILLFRAFASGCSAMTGVEAISNGVAVFEEPASKNAKITLVWMSLLLALLFLGITGLAHIYGIVPKQDQTLISLLGLAVFGKTTLYYATQAATALILFLAANTSYADFPRLASLLAQDRYLPRQLTSVGDRLVFSNGIAGLSLSAIILVILFKGETIHLLPLYAVGVFLSFTLSQAGMVVHHIHDKKPGWTRSLVINAVGAVATLFVLLDIASTKFIHGAWVVVLMIPTFVLIFTRVHKHYITVGKELSMSNLQRLTFQPIKHTVIVPISGIHQGVLQALQYALSISDDVRACYVEIDAKKTEKLKEEWERWVPGVPFVVLKSPYRSVIQPLIKYIEDVEQITHDDVVTVVVPEFVTSKWWHSLLHNQTALFIRTALAFKKGKVVTSVRYHLKST